MGKRTIVIILGLVIFLAGIVLIAASNVSKEVFVEYKEPLVEPLKGLEIMDMALYLPYAGKCGINMTGSFQGYEGQPTFKIMDYYGVLVFSAPRFNASAPSSNIVEFDIDEPGFYSIDFNILVSNDSRVELYQYRNRMEDIRPYAYLYTVGVPVAVLGIVANVVGLFVLSKPKE